MTRLEQQLYWSFEQAAKSVIKPNTFGDRCGTAQADPYAAHHAAAKLHLKIAQLDDLHAQMLRGKYGLDSGSLKYLADLVQQKFGYTETVALGMVLAWLNHPNRPRVHQLADLLDVSERTVKRKTRAVFCYLDEVNLAALYHLSLRLA